MGICVEGGLVTPLHDDDTAELLLRERDLVEPSVVAVDESPILAGVHGDDLRRAGGFGKQDRRTHHQLFHVYLHLGPLLARHGTRPTPHSPTATASSHVCCECAATMWVAVEGAD